MILKEYAIHVKFNTTRTLYIIDQKSRLVKDYISLNAKYNMFYRVIIIKWLLSSFHYCNLYNYESTTL